MANSGRRPLVAVWKQLGHEGSPSDEQVQQLIADPQKCLAMLRECYTSDHLFKTMADRFTQLVGVYSEELESTYNELCAQQSAAIQGPPAPSVSGPSCLLRPTQASAVIAEPAPSKKGDSLIEGIKARIKEIVQQKQLRRALWVVAKMDDDEKEDCWSKRHGYVVRDMVKVAKTAPLAASGMMSLQ